MVPNSRPSGWTGVHVDKVEVLTFSTCLGVCTGVKKLKVFSILCLRMSHIILLDHNK